LAYNGIRKATFTFNIFDRFSNLVYTTNNINDLSCENGWNGTHYKTGNELPMGTYIYQIYYQDFDGWKHQETSDLILVR
jgi:gliding motility-associated-like protein